MTSILDDFGNWAFDNITAAGVGVATGYGINSVMGSIVFTPLGAAAVASIAVAVDRIASFLIHRIHERYAACTYHADKPKDVWVQRESAPAMGVDLSLLSVGSWMGSKAAVALGATNALFFPTFFLAYVAKKVGTCIGTHAYMALRGIKTGIHYDPVPRAPIDDPLHPKHK